MFNFLNTAVLVAAVAAAFPFLLHLFSKRKVKVVPFSSITFLKAMQKRQVRAIKIKQLLLLVIRTLIVLLVVLAFARPATKGGYLGSHATVSAVIIVDNSASMGLSVKDGRLFDLAIKKAKGVITQLEQSDEAAVITTAGDFSRPESGNAFGNPAAAMSFADKIELTDGRADLMRSFNQAVTLLNERLNLNREIYIISDLQETSFDPARDAQDFGGKVFLVDLPAEDVDNSGVAQVDLGNQLIEVGTEFTATATVKKYSGSGNPEMLVSIYLDDKRVGQNGLQLKAGETGSVPFALSVTSPGYHAGYVSLSDDDLLADNVYYFTFYIPDRFTVLLVGEDDVDTRLFRLALAPDETVRRHWSVQQVGYRLLPTINLSQYDVVFLANCGSLSESDVARIKEYARKGGGLLVNLGRMADSASYNRGLADLTGVALTSSFPRQFSRSGFYLISDFDLDHQILSVFKGIGGKQDFSFKSFARAKSAVTKGDSVQVLARYSDGSAAAAVSGYGRGRVMFLNIDVGPDISDISLHPFFVPFIVRSCEFLSSDFSAYSETMLAGSSPTRTLRKSFSVANEYALIAPNGGRTILAGRQQGELQVVECGRVDRAGTYSIVNEQTVSDRFAVNVDPAEGDLYRGDWDELAARYDGAERLPYTADLAGFIAEKRFGRELWQYFLAAAALLLLVEMAVARDRGAPLPSEE